MTGRTLAESETEGSRTMPESQVAGYLASPVTGAVSAPLQKILGVSSVQIDPFFLNGTADPSARVTVTKRIGNAVVRNRMKRRFRALLRDMLPEHGLPGHDHVLIGREGGVERDFAKLREELAAALSRAAQGKGDPARRRKAP